MIPGDMQERIGYDLVDLAPAGNGSSSNVRRRWVFRWYDAKVQMTLFLIAQPVTAALWSWALHQTLPGVEEYFRSQATAINAVLFYAAFSVLVIALFPLGVIDLAAGFLFGMLVGFPLALATKTSGSVLCFLLSRHTCSGYLRRTLVEHYDWLAALSLMMRQEELRTMLLLRLSVIPAGLKNYGCGSLSVSLRVYALATAIALSLESSLLVPVGAQIDSLQGIFSRKQTVQEKAGLIAGIVLLLALLCTIKRTVRLQIEHIHRDTGLQDTESRSASGGSISGHGDSHIPPRERGRLPINTMEHAVL